MAQSRVFRRNARNTMLSKFPSYPDTEPRSGDRYYKARLFSKYISTIRAAFPPVVLDCANQPKFPANSFRSLRLSTGWNWPSSRVVRKEDDDPETTSSRKRGTHRRVVDIEKGSINDWAFNPPSASMRCKIIRPRVAFVQQPSSTRLVQPRLAGHAIGSRCWSTPARR